MADDYAKVEIRLASNPLFTRVQVEGKLLPVASVTTQSEASFDGESYVILRIPLQFVELEQDR